MSLRVATDIGGTFTDLVAFDDEAGTLVVGKASTTPADLPMGVLDAVAAAEVSLEGVAELVHGTTVVINALTERRGARTALVTTKGFRDVLEIGRGNRPDMYNLVSRKPQPFVPRRHRFEIRERVDRHGTVLVPLELSDLEPAVEVCRRDAIEAVAVCLLHSYAHPAHEEAVREALEAALPGLAVTISCEITREWREYERSSTTVLNAYVQPTVEQYLDALERRLRGRGLRRPPRIVQSNGGTTSVANARRRPINLVESGPAAGVIGAAEARGADRRAERALPRHRRHDGQVLADRGRPDADHDRVPDRVAAGLRGVPGARAGRRPRRDRRRRRIDRVGRHGRLGPRRPAERRRRSRSPPAMGAAGPTRR